MPATKIGMNLSTIINIVNDIDFEDDKSNQKRPVYKKVQLVTM
jgi:hypothetical protein